MSQISTNSFFDDQLLAGPRPMDLMSPGERLEAQLQAQLNPKIDPETEALADTIGGFGTGILSSFTGYVGARAATFVRGLTSDDEAYATPLNFNPKEIKKYDPFSSTPMTLTELGVGQVHLPSQRNNIEAITEDLMGIDPKAHAWILSSTNYGDYLDRLDLARIASPEFASKGSGLGKAVGFAGDTAAIITMSLALEPLAFAGYGQRFIQAGQNISRLRSVERFGAMVRISEEAAQAAQMVGRFSGIGRYAALGVAEEAAIKVAKYSVDPLYDPEASSIVTDAAISMAFGGAVGGWAARSYASDRIAKYAENFYHQSRLGGNTIINYHTPLAFVSNAAADRNLLGRNIMPVGETVDSLADEAWEAYSRTGREFVPGTESLSLPIMQGEGTINRVDDVGAAMISGDRRMAAFGPAFYTPGNENLLRVLLNEGRTGGWRGARARTTGIPLARGEFARDVRRLIGLPERLRPSGVVLANRRGPRLAGGLAEDTLEGRVFYPGGQGLGEGIEIAFDATTLRGDFLPNGRNLFAAAQEGDVAFRYGGNWRNLNRSVQSVTISPIADAVEANSIRDMLRGRGWNQRTLRDGTQVWTPQNRPRFRATNEQWQGAVTGIQSATLNILAEIQRRGGTVSQDLARTVARTLFAVHAENLRGAAFESRVWANLTRFLEPNVADRITEARRLGNAVSVGNLDTAFDDLVERSQTLDGLWAHFEDAVTSAPIGQSQNASLILQVANEVRMRGGEVTREIFEEIVEDLRSVMQNPPMRRNSRGRMVLDSRARLSQVAEIINRRVPEAGRRIYMPRSLEATVRSFGESLDVTRRAAVAAERARLQQGAPAVPGAPAGAAVPPPGAGSVPSSGIVDIPTEASSIPTTINLPNGFRAVRNPASIDIGPQSQSFNIIDPDTGLSAGTINFEWDALNGMFRPEPPAGVNLFPQAQNRGIYPAFIRELNKYVDIGSTSIDEIGTAPNAQKVWRKLGAVIQNVRGDEDIPRAFVLRRSPPAGGGAVPPAGGAAPPAATVAATSANGMRRMQEEIPQLDRFDTLGPVARFFNQAAVGLRLPNPAARLAFFLSFNARRAMQTASGVRVAQGQTIFERGTYEMTGHLATGLTAYRNGYTRFALGRGTGDRISLMDGIRAGFGRGARQRLDEFNVAVVEQLRTGAFNHANDGVNETARQLRRMFNDLHTAANQAGVRGFQTSAVQNYVPRLWRWDRISRLSTTVEGRAALTALLERALSQGTGVRRVVLENGNMVDLPDVPQAAEVLTERLIRLSQDSDLAPLLDIDDQVAQALNGLLGPLSGAGASRTPFGRTRIILDELSDHATTTDLLGTGRNGVSIADLTVNDVPELMKKYTISIFGAINERRFIDSFNEQMNHFGVLDANGAPLALETIEEIRSTINRLGNIDPTFGGTMQGEANDAFREIVAAMRYEPLHRSNQELGSLGRWGDRLAGVMLPMGYLSTGGSFGLVAAAETSRIIGTLGLRTTLRQLPLLSEMVSNWRNMDEGARNFAGLIDQAFHPSTDRLRRTLMQQVQNQYGPVGNAFERGLGATANFFSDVTLLTPVTSFTQNLMAASTIQHLYEVSRGLTRRMDDATIRTLGLEPNQYDELLDYVGTNAVTAARGGSDRVVNLNNLNDIRMDNLRSFVDRAVRTRIQDMPTRGDFHRIGFSFFGRLLTQFRGFNLKGVDNFALQNLSRVRRGDAASRVKVAQEIAYTMIFGALVQYARNYMDAQSFKESGQRKRAKEVEDRLLGVDGFVRGGFTGPSEFFLPIFAIDAGWNTFVSDDPLFSAYRYSGLNWYGFPAASFAAKSFDISKDVFGRAIAKPLGIEDKERDITQATVHKARLILPFQNFLPVKHFFNLAEEEIANEFRLLERQPRRDRKED